MKKDDLLCHDCVDGIFENGDLWCQNWMGPGIVASCDRRWDITDWNYVTGQEHKNRCPRYKKDPKGMKRRVYKIEYIT